MPISHKTTLRRDRVAAADKSAPDKPRDNGFDVLSHDHRDKPDSEPLIGRKGELRDHERGIGPGLKLHPKRMPMQAAPDHGTHE
jgi:hypothetical protein